jgi:hypothetical protein
VSVRENWSWRYRFRTAVPVWCCECAEGSAVAVACCCCNRRCSFEESLVLQELGVLDAIFLLPLCVVECGLVFYVEESMLVS